ncbi:Hypothetical protein NGAL_HAMBI2427_36650 [Neorhizobium galegae bv. orientalis]|uniref:Uncharacterized protein n=1 Tax=Neorhizobium galegae bv. orientalis str. HAMBI 540 TaxID=1028800 RepID=A0A068SS40_NEOGA|nr:Hypothetical protein RG540_CH29560 [Neorhizobium galegae bv. orientalis str. HAMBI 540]CDZ50457.1 Hypothetical protein NGAL_HAMBI2427_36650 [Neorhizobium galegae bv. orientalis]
MDYPRLAANLPLDSADTLSDFMNSVGMVPDKDTLH